MIKVEHLSKEYLIRHNSSAKYSSLRDELMVKVRGVFRKDESKVMERFMALNDVSFEVNQGDRVGIIGRNGAGKSTLLKVLSRIVTPTSGKITIEGRVASLLEVGTGFHPELTGRENIFLNGSILGMSREEIRSKFDEIVAFSEVEKFLDTPVKRYSSGMYVRLAFSVAAHLEPEILIVDEVLAVGDAAFQKKCLGKMKDVSGQGRTVLFVSHNMDAVQRLCSKGILLNKGNLILAADINSVCNRYMQTASDGKAWSDYAEPEDTNGFIYRMQVENRDDQPVNEVMIGDYFQVRVFYKLRKPMEEVVIALGISTSMDQPIRTTWSHPLNSDAGEYEAVFCNDGFQLVDGQYKLTLGLSYQKRTLHYIDNAGVLSISEVNSLVSNDRVVNTKSGLIMNQMEVEIKRLN
jgi:lipopolysaccharide transport system ATP-binding protein